MGKRVFAFFGLAVLVVFVSLGFFRAEITGNSISSLVDTPVVSGQIIQGSLILDISGVPIDSEVVLTLGDQEVRKPLSNFISSSDAVPQKIEFSPEVKLALEYVPGGSVEDFKTPSPSLDIGGASGGGDTGGESCPDDIKECGDGTFVRRNPDLNCEFDECSGGEVKDDIIPGGNIVGSVILGEEPFGEDSEEDLIIAEVRRGSPITVKTGDDGVRLIKATVNGEEIDFDFVSGVSARDGFVIDTSYKLEVDGFGDAGFIELDLGSFEIVAEPGVLETAIVYEGTLISSSTSSISSLGDQEEDFLVAKTVRELQKSGAGECESSVEVRKCVVDLSSADVFNDEVNPNRVTKIIQRDCESTEVREIKCSDKTPVTVKKTVNEEEEMLEVYEEDTGDLVSSVVLSEGGQLYIEFLQSPANVADSCYNGVKDAGEEGVDCGSVCLEDCPGNPFIWGIVSVLALLIIYFVFRNVSFGGQVGGSGGGLESSFREYNRLRRSGKLDRASQRRARSLYKSLRRGLSRRGLKVVKDKKEKGKLPKLLYRR